jgi:hypothetical protein
MSFNLILMHGLRIVFKLLVYIYATYLFIQDELSLSSLIIVFNLIGQLIWGMINGFSFINRFTAAWIFSIVLLSQSYEEEAHQNLSIQIISV